MGEFAQVAQNEEKDQVRIKQSLTVERDSLYMCINILLIVIATNNLTNVIIL